MKYKILVYSLIAIIIANFILETKHLIEPKQQHLPEARSFSMSPFMTFSSIAPSGTVTGPGLF